MKKTDSKIQSIGGRSMTFDRYQLKLKVQILRK